LKNTLMTDGKTWIQAKDICAIAAINVENNSYQIILDNGALVTMRYKDVKAAYIARAQALVLLGIKIADDRSVKEFLIEKAGDFEISEEDIRSALEAAEQEARDEPGKVNAWRERWRMLFTKMGRGNR
jgi:hypothetical protein